MTDEQDIDMLAAEYVLGTLPADERAAVALRARHDAPLATAITAWESRLAPLSETIAPQPAPGHLWARIVDRLDRLGTAKGTQMVSVDAGIDMARMALRLVRWQATALAASAIAAGLLLFVCYRELTRPGPEKSLVAVLQKDAQSPAFLVSVDLEKKLLTIRAVAAPHHAGKSYELWLIHDSLNKPRSLGVVGDAPFTVVKPKLTAYAPRTIQDATLAVTLEPEGGSPTGDPTGPVVYSGKLIQATE
jgi:anti-sigma-K factor RskA